MDAMQHRTFHNLDCEIHYWYREGSQDRWVLFFHGAGLDHRMFEDQFSLFDPTYHVIAWDARGHGQSRLPEAAEFRFGDMVSDCFMLYQIHSIADATLIGQSMGGNLAQEIAYRAPELVRSMVLIDCTNNTGRLSLMEKLTLKTSKLVFACYPWQTLIRQSAAASANRPEVRAYILQCFRQLDKKTFVSVMLSMIGSCLHPDEAYRFHQPVLLLCGADDRLGNIRKTAGRWAVEDENCTLGIIGHSGHNSNQDNPAQVNALIAEFLKLAH